MTFLIEIKYIYSRTDLIGDLILLRHYKLTVLTECQIWLGFIAILVHFSNIDIIETISITHKHDSG